MSGSPARPALSTTISWLLGRAWAISQATSSGLRRSLRQRRHVEGLAAGVVPPNDGLRRRASGPRNLGDIRRAGYTYPARRVYDTCMAKVRTNIEIEDAYVQAIMNRYGVRTKTEAVELALRHLAGQPMTREEALSMRGAHALDEPPADVSPGGAA